MLIKKFDQIIVHNLNLFSINIQRILTFFECTPNYNAIRSVENMEKFTLIVQMIRKQAIISSRGR
jgi:hypothetical protein